MLMFVPSLPLLVAHAHLHPQREVPGTRTHLQATTTAEPVSQHSKERSLARTGRAQQQSAATLYVCVCMCVCVCVRVCMYVCVCVRAFDQMPA
jgi:hypothetical protein